MTPTEDPQGDPQALRLSHHQQCVDSPSSQQSTNNPHTEDGISHEQEEEEEEEADCEEVSVEEKQLREEEGGSERQQQQGSDSQSCITTGVLHSRREGAGPVSSLLQFVAVAGGDIRAALDKSAPCKRSVDHRKYLQRQLRRYTGYVTAAASEEDTAAELAACEEEDSSHKSPDTEHMQYWPHPLKSGDSALPSASSHLAGEHSASPGKVDRCATEIYRDTNGHLAEARATDHVHGGAWRPQTHEMLATSDEPQEYRGIQDVPLKRTSPPPDRGHAASASANPCGQPTPKVTMTSQGHLGGQVLISHPRTLQDMESDPLFEKVISHCGLKATHPLCHNFDGHAAMDVPAEQDSSVPLRHRRLPASFWQEPDVPKQPDLPAQYQKYGHMLMSCGLYKDLLSHGYSGGVTSHQYHAQLGLHSAAYAAVAAAAAETSLYQSLQAKYSAAHAGDVPGALTTAQYPGSPRWPAIHAGTQGSFGVKSPPGGSVLPPLLESRVHYPHTDIYRRTAAGHAGQSVSSPTAAPSHYTLGLLQDAVTSQSLMTSQSHGLSHGPDVGRAHVWRPIPTKSATSTGYPATRYHPFADVR